ncbi:MAG: hypothetical protein PHT47_00465 [Candidatus Cloacimonetes bacterium]|nr:hypothetical protein [Candidatus Cloacimonadota bacterium]
MKKRVLITVKTYPNPSKNYIETVCTAGLDEDLNWIRLYPIPFRAKPLNQQFKKFQWIEVDLVKTEKHKDFRPESHRLADIEDEISTGEEVSSWDVRNQFILHNVYDNLDQLINASQEPTNTSIAVFKPTIWEKSSYVATEREWTQKQKDNMLQMNIFDTVPRNPLRKIPFEFKYSFADAAGRKSTMQILDWEIGQLYWNCFDKSQDEGLACKQVLDKLDRLANDRDLYLILGTTFEHHQRRFPNPFTIIGLFYPPKDDQISIF